ncbi:hypothetical protein G7Y89_g15028 [Cudoniella acicularis]|uniref:Xylanolytic transcriptional activator regulatory domain-containing protein n=1 Tax=Cudoniella acicularis TaxID=354080 RepID=A0A8H4VS12_9HELO|nr:hypothetical protein G7Y89_g15028 [Cudoniella acicularis]
MAGTRRAVCRYGETLEPRRYGDEIVNAASPNIGASGSVSTWTSIPKAVLGTLDPTMRLSILLTNSISEVIHSTVLEKNAHQSSPSMDAIFYSQIKNILQTDGQYFESILSKYFDGVHKWLPILSKKLLYDRLQFLPTTPAADFSILLLAMRLITQLPSMDPEVDQDREILYLATKTLFSQIQAFVPSSLRLVQAGIILAHYENAHGMSDAAYVTIGTCTRMAYILGLQNTKCSDKIHGSDAWLDEEESLSTWWGLVICDRIIALSPDMADRPLATRTIHDDDYLPLEPDDLGAEIGRPVNPLVRYRYPVSATSLPSMGSFAREAQATYLMQKVRNVIDSGQVFGDHLISVGSELQSLLGTVMSQTTGRSGEYSGALQMLIVGMYDLHYSAVEVAEGDVISGAAETIQLTLKTITRIIIDIAHAFNANWHTFDIEHINPARAHLTKCIQHHILMRNHIEEEQWLHDFAELKKMLEYCSLRWILPGKELRRIMQNVDMPMSQ